MPLQVYLTEMVALFINGFPRPAGRRKYLFCLLDEIGVQSLAERLSQELIAPPLFLGVRIKAVPSESRTDFLI